MLIPLIVICVLLFFIWITLSDLGKNTKEIARAQQDIATWYVVEKAEREEEIHGERP